ncbi:MAG: hypothetical protein BMS9Abin07_0276 [Acidimicrobiia bacterium]|nr:MAG: hypothetical protein BMS9Abin07_0276 [Acidimicrobiia bacterium]
MPELTLEQAYEATYLWLFHVDQPPTEVVEKPPEMVEMYSEKLLSWVRAGRKVPQKSILALLQLEDQRKKAIFSAGGFSPGAVSVSESHGVALFVLRPDGSVAAETGHAAIMMPKEGPPPPFAVEDEPDPLAGSPGNWGTTKFDSTVWVDCPECGTNQHVSLDSCRACGTRLVKEKLAPIEDPEYKCRVCGSHDIEVINEGSAAIAQRQESRH